MVEVETLGKLVPRELVHASLCSASAIGLALLLLTCKPRLLYALLLFHHTNPF